MLVQLMKEYDLRFSFGFGLGSSGRRLALRTRLLLFTLLDPEFLLLLPQKLLYHDCTPLLLALPVGICDFTLVLILGCDCIALTLSSSEDPRTFSSHLE